MNLVSFIIVFLVVWMILFFISLPVGVKVSERHEKGFANSAPDKTNLKMKLVETHADYEKSMNSCVDNINMDLFC